MSGPQFTIMPKTCRSEVIEKCQKVPCPRSQKNAENALVSSYKKGQKVPGPRSQKMPKTRRSAVIERCQKLAVPQSQKNAKRSQVRAYVKMPETRRSTIPPVADLSIDATVIVTIYGITEQSVAMAEKRLRSVITTHILSDSIDDPRICQLSMQVVENLHKVAQDHQVEIEIDQDKVLHTINLHGCQSDALAVKDKVRDALAMVSKEETKADAADAVHATIRWTRLLSGEGMDEYDYMTNYEIEQAYKKKEKTYEFKSEAENFVVNFTAWQEKDQVTGDIVKVKRRDLIKGIKI